MKDLIIHFEALRIKREAEEQRRVAKEQWLNSIPDDIEELRAGYASVRRLLNRARRIELEATSKGKERLVLISDWDTDYTSKPIEKYWVIEAAELAEHDCPPTFDAPEEAFEILKELEASISQCFNLT